MALPKNPLSIFTQDSSYRLHPQEPSGKVFMRHRKTVFDRVRPQVILVFMALVSLGLVSLLSFLFKSAQPLLIGLLFLITEVALLWIYGTLSTKKDSKAEEKLGILNEITLDFLMNVVSPITILGEKGEILWYNKTFSALSGSNFALYNQNINEIADEKISIRRLRDETTEELCRRPVIAKLGGTNYEVVSYKLTSSDKKCIITVWSSLDRIEKLETELTMKNPVISYIAVDNYSESYGFMQSNYRTITAKISILLKEWSDSIHGILREVESDRYILIFEEQYLNDITGKKFDILDTVREISTDNVDIPVTISIGCACMDASMSEKEAVAHQALDLALQRGGDQAVLKLRNNATEFYGGRTKTVQKRTKIRSRIIATEVMNLMKNASNVLIMGHRFADHDSIGSSIGMARFAMQYCDKVNIVVNVHDANLKSIFARLRGLEDYRNIFIDGASAQDLVASGTLLIITDVNNIRQFEAPELFENIQTTVIIDHHRQSAEFTVKPKITYIEPSASSASELVSEMLEQQFPPGTLLKEEAELLFAGIILDTKQFTNNTGPRTFSAAFFLRSEGANPAEAQMLFRSGIDDFKREIKYENNAFIYRDIIAFSYIEESASQEDKIAASKAADRLLSLEGVLASFVLCRVDNVVHISARSSGTVNVQLITEKLNGGGHFDMAGAQVKDASIKETFVKLKEAIDQYLNEV